MNRILYSHESILWPNVQVVVGGGGGGFPEILELDPQIPGLAKTSWIDADVPINCKMG
jgi:hypothetical protein